MSSPLNREKGGLIDGTARKNEWAQQEQEIQEGLKAKVFGMLIGAFPF